MVQQTKPILAVLFLWLLLVPLTVAAQDETPPDAPPAKVVSGPLTTALPHLRWDVEERGPLLIVGAEKIVGPSLSTVPAGGYNLAALAPAFHSRLVRLPTLTVLAPTERADIIERLPRNPLPSDAVEEDPTEGLLRLYGSLTEAQWRKIGGPEGIGRNDLTVMQRPMWDVIFPSRTILMRNDVPDEKAMQAAVPLTTGQRANARLRVARQYTMKLLAEGDSPLEIEQSIRHVWQMHRRQAQDERVPLIVPTPNRLVQGNLDFDAPHFHRTIALKPTETVKSLMARIAAETRVELYADARFGELTVHTRGEQATVRDLLKALSWAVCGTFRYVGQDGDGVYFLSYNLDGIAPRIQRIADATIAEILPSVVTKIPLSDARDRAPDTIRQAGILRYLSISPLSDLVPDEALAAELTRPDLTGKPPEEGDAYMPIPVSRLPSAARAAWQNSVERLRLPPGSTPPSRSRVGVLFQVNCEFILPEYGIVKQETFPILPPPLPTPPATVLAFPPGIPALEVTAASVREAEQAVAAARRNDFKQLWLRLPPSLPVGRQEEVLKAAIAAGEKRENEPPVAVLAIVGLRRRELPEMSDGSSDETVFGGSAVEGTHGWLENPALRQIPRLYALLGQVPDWIRPDSAAMETRIRDVARLARTPGLYGVSLEDTLPPSGFGAGDSTSDLEPFYLDVGYTVAARRDFIRRYQHDPRDIPPRYTLMMAWFLFRLPEQEGIPYLFLRQEALDEMSRAWERWNQVRLGAHRALMARVFSALRAGDTGKNCRLFVRDPAGSQGGKGWWGLWERATSIPGLTTPSDDAETPAGQARAASRQVLWVISPGDADRRESLRESGYASRTGAEERLRFVRFVAGQFTDMRTQAKNGGAWDGFVLDLSDRPLAEAVRLLEALPRVGSGAAEVRR
jgi:hypothetical protein